MKVDDTLTLSCSASCDLQPTISWLFNGVPSLPQGAAIEISNDLIVLSANHTHGGTYPCSASNLLSSIYANVIVYVEYPETCSVVKTNISEENGDYVIDPDGAQGENPFPVCCDMISQGGVGVTVVSHNSESRTHVTEDDHDDYERDIQYVGSSFSQLAGLTIASTNCQQFIKNECKKSKLKDIQAYLRSRDGAKMTYWVGSSYGHKCVCGRTHSCADPGEGCNCNKNDNTWREDSGLLTLSTDESHLPVSQLRFGDIGGDGEEGYHTLGNSLITAMSLVTYAHNTTRNSHFSV